MGRPFIREQNTFISQARVADIVKDDFESTTSEWVSTGDGAAYTAARVTTKKFSGSACWQMETDAAVPAANQTVRSTRYTGIVLSTDENVLFSCRFAYNGDRQNINLTFAHVIGAGGQSHDIYVRWAGASQRWEYRNATPAFVAFPTTITGFQASGSTDDYWNYVELVVNPSRQEYVSFRINGDYRDMSGLAYDVTNLSRNLESALFRMTLETLDAAQKQIWFDEIYAGHV
jgi:hypothetical protein